MIFVKPLNAMNYKWFWEPKCLDWGRHGQKVKNSNQSLLACVEPEDVFNRTWSENNTQFTVDSLRSSNILHASYCRICWSNGLLRGCWPGCYNCKNHAIYLPYVLFPIIIMPIRYNLHYTVLKIIISKETVLFSEEHESTM